MGLTEKLEKLARAGKKVQEVKGKIGETAEGAKKTLYEQFGRVEQKGFKGVGELVAEGAERITKKAKGIYDEVQAQGGIGQYAKNLADKFADFGQKGVESIVTTYKIAEKCLYDSLGKFSEKQAQEVVDNLPGKSKEVVQQLIDQIRKGSLTVVSEYRQQVPSREELSDRYKGVGTKKRGVLLRPALEDCVTYHNIARQHLPGGLNLRKEILDDIKAYVITSVEQHTALYAEQKKDTIANPNAEKKLAIVEQKI